REVLAMHRKDGHRAPGIASAGLTAMALVVSAAAVLPGVAHAAPPPPALEYTMEGVDGATVPDTSGNGHDGTLVGETSVTDGVDGEALQLGRVSYFRSQAMTAQRTTPAR